MNEYYMAAMYSLDDIQSDSAVEAASIVLQPGESKVLTIVHSWANSEEFGVFEQPTVPEAGVTMDYDITLGFEQVAAN